MKAHKCGIYAITHVDSGKKYVGQSAKIRDRWLWHKSALRRGTHSNRKLQNAWNKYGESAFSFALLESTPPDDAALCACEQRWIDLLRPAYNMAPVAGTTRGLKHPPRTPEFRAKMRQARLGFRHSPETIERLRQMAAESDYTHPPEVRARISSALTGRKLSPDHAAKSRVASLGRKQTPSEIARRSESLKGHSVSAETRAKIGAANKVRHTGRKQSPEWVENRIAPLRGRKRPPHLISDLHRSLKAANDARMAERVAIAKANPGIPIGQLAALIGCSFKTASKAHKLAKCQ